MPISNSAPDEWRFVFDAILVSLLFLLLLLTFILLFSKRGNVPISQSIEVDPREPHSITITFVPSSLISSSNPIPIAVAASTASANVNTNNETNTNTTTEGIRATTVVSDTQTAPVA